MIPPSRFRSSSIEPPRIASILGENHLEELEPPLSILRITVYDSRWMTAEGLAMDRRNMMGRLFGGLATALVVGCGGDTASTAKSNTVATGKASKDGPAAMTATAPEN